MTAVSPRLDGPAPVSSTLTVGDLEAGRFTAEQLEAYVPQTRAEARALMAAKAAVENPTRRSRAAQREAARHRSTRGAARREVAGRSFTRPRQAVALLALTGVMGAAQATASAGSSPGADVIAAQATGLDLPSQLLSSLPYIVTIIVLGIISADRRLLKLNGVASLGEPFER